ncbi:MAG: glycosyltransferase family 2 protein [Candidatus Thorarchaeota archaeon]|jgi:glycosyltransferase involved in cell wall biosynthesis
MRTRFIERIKMDFPVVSVLIVTYDRPREIRQTIAALDKHIHYPRDKLRWHLCDDSSPGDYVYEIQRDFKHLGITATLTDRKGWGANVNKGLKFCWKESDIVLLNEDDRPPTKQYNLEKAVALLASIKDCGRPEAAKPRKPIGAIRLGGIASHWLTLQSREAETGIGKLNYLHILHNSPFLNVYSNQPFISHRRFFDFYGLYPEGRSLADTETIYAHKVKDTEGGPWVCILTNGIDTAQDHIGRSRQATGLDIGHK